MRPPLPVWLREDAVLRAIPVNWLSILIQCDGCSLCQSSGAFVRRTGTSNGEAPA